LSPLFDESLTDFPTPLKAVDRSELIRLQESDPDLSAVFDLVNKAEHPYTIRAGVLVRAWRYKLSPQEATFHQIVVPTALRAKLLSVAHEIPAAGQLGVAKTKDRLLRNFYWPSLGKCAPNPPAPLHSLPFVSEPFCHVAINIVGPLPVG